MAGEALGPIPDSPERQIRTGVSRNPADEILGEIDEVLGGIGPDGTTAGVYPLTADEQAEILGAEAPLRLSAVNRPRRRVYALGEFAVAPRSVRPRAGLTERSLGPIEEVSENEF